MKVYQSLNIVLPMYQERTIKQDFFQGAENLSIKLTSTYQRGF